MKNPKCFPLLKLFALSGLLLLLTSSARAWRFSLLGGSRAESVVVDSAGNIIAAGRAYYGGEVVKISGTTGQVIWQYNASHLETEDGVGSIALDSKGDVFLLIGAKRGVVKISGVTGQRIWDRPIGGSVAGCQSRFNAIVIDRNDDVVAAGTAGCLFSVGKLSGVTGDERWHYEHEGYAKAVAVDPFGNVAAAGLINRNFGTVKLRGDTGAELWEREINGAGNFSDVFEEANAIAMDKDGSVVSVGATSNEVGNFRDFTVARYLPDGTAHWIQIVNGLFRVSADSIDNSNDIANAVVIDKDGSVIAAGSLQESLDIPRSPEPEHFHVVKISKSGNVVWSRPAEDPVPAAPGLTEYSRGYAFSLSVNAAGNVVAGGQHNGRFTLVKFWGRTGGRAWRRQLTSGMDPSFNGNQANSVLMDAASDVIAAGETIPESGGLSQFTVVKLRRIDGLDYEADPIAPPVPETVAKYAPVVYLHSQDDYRPDSPTKFVNNSSLWWFHEGGCNPHNVAELHSIEPQRLGSSNETDVVPYSDNPVFPTVNGFDCTSNSQITFTTRNLTRPYDDGRSLYNAFWYNAFYEREGFYLDLDDGDPQDELRGGIESGPVIFPGAPVFYEYVPHLYVTYWFFYPYDKFEIPALPNQHHEGDWERISIQLNANETPTNVFYYAHENGEFAPWLAVDKFDGTHPVVYSAKGSHASYLKQGEQEKLQCFLTLCAHDSTDRGPRWSTWNDLRKVEAQPWYGFGGAWGQVDAINTPGGSFYGKYFTGPLGPSPYKTSRDKWADTIPPMLNLPANISVNADIPQGATVQFTVTATDNVTQNPRVVCTSTSGSVFAVGTTIVSCTASDDAGNSANGTFNIIVKGAGEQIIDLTILVKRFNFPNGTENSLLVKLQNAFTKLTRGDNAGACSQLRAFMSEVEAQSNKKLTAGQTNQILAAANRIRTVIGC
jgi:hypothetical protein